MMFYRIFLVRILESLSLLLSQNSRISTEQYRLSHYSKTHSISGKEPFSEIIKQASEKYGVDEKVIKAVIKHESAFNPQAVSRCGAQGLMQLMPATAKSLGVSDAFDTEQNIMAGTRYLKQKLDEFDGNLHLALAAYNAGSGAVRKYGGIPPYKETQNYVNQVMKSIVDYTA
ncbi:MAG: lytic transglycosylase domain-containing protein [Syntrophaceticus sp.]